MRLYEVSIKNDEIINLKFISEKLSLPIINSHFSQYSYTIDAILNIKKYPKVNNLDSIRIEDSGKTLIYKENDGTYIYVIDIDHESMIDYKD